MAILDGSEFNAEQYGPQSVFDRGRVGMMAEFRGQSGDAAVQTLQMNDQLMRKREQDMHLAAIKAQQDSAAIRASQQIKADKAEEDQRKRIKTMSNTIGTDLSTNFDYIDAAVKSGDAEALNLYVSNLKMKTGASDEEFALITGGSAETMYSLAQMERANDLTGDKHRQGRDLATQQSSLTQKNEAAKQVLAATIAQGKDLTATEIKTMYFGENLAEDTKISATHLMSSFPGRFPEATFKEVGGKVTGLDRKHYDEVSWYTNAYASTVKQGMANWNNLDWSQKQKLEWQKLAPKTPNEYRKMVDKQFVGRIGTDGKFYAQDSKKFLDQRRKWILGVGNTRQGAEQLENAKTLQRQHTEATPEFRAASPELQARMVKEAEKAVDVVFIQKNVHRWYDLVARGISLGSDYVPDAAATSTPPPAPFKVDPRDLVQQGQW